jgi:hypothetical protein
VFPAAQLFGAPPAPTETNNVEPPVNPDLVVSMNSPAPPPPPTPPAPAPPPPTTNTSTDATPAGTLQLQDVVFVRVKVKTVKPLGGDGLVVGEHAGIEYLITTIPDPPFPALSLPEFVKPPAPPPPVFALPLLETENG